MKKAFIVCIAVLLCACIVKSHFDGICNSYGYAGSSVTVGGVYCWRRENVCVDEFNPLKVLVERARAREKIQECIEAGGGVKCDPRYIPPPQPHENG